MSRERDGGIDEGADARGGLGCTERDGELHLLSKIRERRNTTSETPNPRMDSGAIATP